MPGSNWNSSYEKLFGEYDWTINTDKEFKSFEKTISSDGWKEDLVKVCEENSENVVAAFDQTKLEEKVKLAKTPDKKATKNKMKPEVKNAYLVIWKLKEGKVWSFNKLLETAEGEVTLEKAKQDILDKINSNSDWNDWLKETARSLIEDIFSECNSVEEFEKRSWTQLSAVDTYDNIWDFFKSIPRAVYEAHKWLDKVMLEFLEKIWATKKEIFDLCKELIEKWVLKRNDFVDYCKEKWMVVADITKTVCEWWKNQFIWFIAFLKETWGDINEALNVAWEWTWKQWNNFVEFCGQEIENLREFWIMLVEKWELAWQQLVEWFKNNLEYRKELCKTLIEKGLVKMREFAEWCVWLWEKWKELFISSIEWSADIWNQFADFCKDNFEVMKDFFIVCSTELLRIWKITLEQYCNRCKSCWDVVKDVACNILVWLVKIGKFTLDAIVDALIITIWIPVMEISKLLIATWKEVYKDVKAFTNFISELSVVLWKKAKELWKSMMDFAKEFVNQCKELMLLSAKNIANVVKWLREWMKNLWMTVTDFIKATYEVIKWSLRGAWDKTAEFFKNLWLKIEDIAVTLREVSKWAWEWCVDFVVKSIKDFKLAMGILIEKCKIGIDKIWEKIMSVWAKVVEFIKYARDLWIITYENISKWCKWEWKKITMFVKTAIDSLKITWEELSNRCGGQIDKIAAALRDIFWKTKEWLKAFVKFVGKWVMEAWRLLFELWIWAVSLVILALKELWLWLVAVTELCVDTLVKYWKLAVNKLCDFLAEAYWKTKDKIVEIWKAVASSVKNASEAIREWVYQKTKDVKKAIEATKEYIKNAVKDISEWMHKKWIQLSDICRVICEEFKWNYREIVAWLKDFARDCAIKWNDVISATSEWLTIDV